MVRYAGRSRGAAGNATATDETFDISETRAGGTPELLWIALHPAALEELQSRESTEEPVIANTYSRIRGWFDPW